MTRDEIRTNVLRLLGNVAPEADPQSLRTNVSFRDQLDIDSMDLLKFMISVHKEFGVEIPERDYPKMMTVDGCVAYIEKESAGKAPG